ncbi:hypothetical protein CHCC20335_4753 [Bacillus paralicheniformis]|nr:hypothetical protein CHCC20335_4753 [Bacillus paralicheniformis]
MKRFSLLFLLLRLSNFEDMAAAFFENSHEKRHWLSMY